MRGRSTDTDDRARAVADFVDRRAIDAAYRYATLILGDRSEAEDATHDAALMAWRRFDELRDRSRFDAWFGRILVNTCRDRLRSRGRTVRLIEPEAAFGAAADPTETTARRQALVEAIRTLSVDHREVVVLRFYADLTVDQIAERVGVGAGTVKSRLHYALRHLRETLGPWDEENRDGR